jgi:UDP-glucose:(heptosyl)LPS alpha-1,3-glucosyltransferase
LLQAMTKTHDRVVLLVAGSPKFAAYERMAQSLGVAARVRFIGHSGDIRRVFFVADMHVHPTYYDPCSLVVLEAMACGLPVITTAHNGAAELMHPPRDGFVINDPSDNDQLAGYLNLLLDDEARSECGRVARQTAANWTFDHHVRALLDILAQAKGMRHAG